MSKVIKTATYAGDKVYVYAENEELGFLLISYKSDGTGKFKVTNPKTVLHDTTSEGSSEHSELPQGEQGEQ